MYDLAGTGPSFGGHTHGTGIRFFVSPVTLGMRTSGFNDCSGHSYPLPPDGEYGLTGSYNDWKVADVEVFHVTWVDTPQPAASAHGFESVMLLCFM